MTAQRKQILGRVQVHELNKFLKQGRNDTDGELASELTFRWKHHLLPLLRLVPVLPLTENQFAEVK